MVAAGADGAAEPRVAQLRYEAIVTDADPGQPLAGAPVLDDSGRLVGIATEDGATPIGRACGPIGNC